ncbi:MAG: site-2 protease family protein [Dactylosporangium sp.]|nr:site-2 protease family protein [Dactylosporangium sp.]NNJ59952.1 site-2 protease family protein [Dactylosporangium sp.]
MAYTLGIVVFALGILLAVCLHEAGHMGAAKAFGMKVTRYFVGFGPTMWSFRRGDTEYGVKALPLGGFVKIVGMTPQDDDVDPADEPRAMWRFPVWKRTVVMAAGSLTHFILAFVALWSMFVFVGIPDPDKIDTAPARVSSVSSCVVIDWELDSTGQTPRRCGADDPESPASQAGLRPGDLIISINGEPMSDYSTMRAFIKTLGDTDATITYQRDGRSHTADMHVYAADRIKDGVAEGKTYAEIASDDLERVGLLGVTGIAPRTTVSAGEGATTTVRYSQTLVSMTFQSLGQLPSKIPNLFSALIGQERDPNTPVSVIGASRIGGELAERRDWTSLLHLFAVLNLFFGLFNLFPLLPMDGGHIAIAWFERARSWAYARLGRADPGRVDYYKLTPITLAVIGILGVFVLLTGTVDIINPITLNR